jgi:nitrate reductase gamma subunit
METFEINPQLDPAMIITAYLIYLPIALLLTYYVARILFKNGRLFEMGFYLLNLGFALVILRIQLRADQLFETQEMIEVLSMKIGGFSIYLGVMLFLNLFLFFRGKRKSKEHQLIQERILSKKGTPHFGQA